MSDTDGYVGPAPGPDPGPTSAPANGSTAPPAPGPPAGRSWAVVPAVVQRWLRPAAPRVVAAWLLVALVVLDLLQRLASTGIYGIGRSGAVDVLLYLLPVLATAAAGLAVAALVLGGSTGSRVLGVVYALGVGLEAVLPVALGFGWTGASLLGAATVVLALVVGLVQLLLALGVVVALLVPQPPTIDTSSATDPRTRLGR